MEWKYYTNKAIRRKIDFILKDSATLFANCGPTLEDRKQALVKEQEYLSKIHELDSNFAERCGYKR